VVVVLRIDLLLSLVFLLLLLLLGVVLAVRRGGAPPPPAKHPLRGLQLLRHVQPLVSSISEHDIIFPAVLGLQC